MNRRNFAFSFVILMAGCTLLENNFATLDRILILNTDDSPAMIEVRIEREDSDEEVYNSTYNVDPNFSGLYVRDEWPQDAPLLISARSNEDENWSTFSTQDRSSCITVVIQNSESGIAFAYGSDEC